MTPFPLSLQKRKLQRELSLHRYSDASMPAVVRLSLGRSLKALITTSPFIPSLSRRGARGGQRQPHLPARSRFGEGRPAQQRCLSAAHSVLWQAGCDPGVPPSVVRPGFSAEEALIGCSAACRFWFNECRRGCLPHRSAGRKDFTSSARQGAFSVHALDTFGACPEPGIIALLSKGHKMI
jgi:hypothetical protein